MVFLREQFIALDQLTLTELEAMFAGGQASHAVPQPGTVAEAIPGAVFFD